jgi:hypothetical protein
MCLALACFTPTFDAAIQAANDELIRPLGSAEEKHHWRQ